MTKLEQLQSDRRTIIAGVMAYNNACDADERDGTNRAEKIRKASPWVDCYDERGNWIGPVRNENGWTP